MAKYNWETSYYSSFNFERTNFEGSTLTTSQHQAARKAIHNTNFRNGLVNGLHRFTFLQRFHDYNTDLWLFNTFTPRGYYFDQSGSDYYQYLLKRISDSTNVPYDFDESMPEGYEDGLYIPDQARKRFELAKAELIKEGLTQSDFPIKIEVLGHYEEEDNNHFIAGADRFNREFGDLFELIIIKPNDKNDEREQRDVRKSFDINLYTYRTVLGDDPIYQLSLVTLPKELKEKYNPLIDEAFSKIDLQKRYELTSEIEYQMIYIDSILIPGVHFVYERPKLTRFQPFKTAEVRNGFKEYKLKGKVVLTEPLTREEENAYREEWHQEWEKLNNPCK